MSEQEDFEIQQKQELLQREIIDKNLDKNAFVNYCLKKKENGDDLNNWTFDELKELVEDFSNSKSAKKDESKKEEENHAESVEKMEKFNANVEEKQHLEKEIQCRKLEKTALNDKEITVQIKNPKEMEKGVFGQNYVLYEITTSPLNWVVTRRYSDFDWLRKTLVKIFPGFNVPPLPKKKMGNRKFDLDFVMKRMKFLELFMNSVLTNENFKASEAVIAMLSYEERNKFENKMKELTSFQPSQYVEEYKTLDGKILISHDDGNEKYFTNIEKYFRLQSQILDKLNFNIKQFYNNLGLCAENMGDIQKNFEILHILNSRVLMKPTITKTHEELGCFFKNWRRIMIKQGEIVKNHIKDFFKWINLEGQAYSELIHNREALKQKYINELTKTNAKKEKIFLTRDINKFEINPDNKSIDKSKLLTDKEYAFENMCYKDNQTVKLLYNQLGHVNKMNIQELKKIIKIYCTRFVDNFKAFDAEFYPSINDVSYLILIFLVYCYMVKYGNFPCNYPSATLAKLIYLKSLNF